MKTALLALLALGLPVAAGAQCATAADVEGAGVMMQADDGTGTFTRLPDGMMQEMYLSAAGETHQILYRGDVWVVKYGPLENGLPVLSDTMVYVYGDGTSELPVPVPGDTSIQQAWSDYGGRDQEETVTAHWGAEEELTLGACSYRVIKGEMIYHYGGSYHVEGIWYFPELGISYLQSWQSDGMEEPDTYPLTGIVPAS